MKKNNMAIFLVLLFVISLASAGLFRLLDGEMTLFASLYMLIPLVSVVITQVVCKEPVLRGLGVSWKINRWWFVGWLGMPLLAFAFLIAAWSLPGMSPSFDNDFVNLQLVVYNEMFADLGITVTVPIYITFLVVSGLFAGITVNALFAFCEEIAWRGFLERELAGKGFWTRSLVIGAIWGVWHAPLILMGHNFPEHPVAGAFVMTLFCIVFTPLMLFLREKSGSVVLSAIVHGTFNAVAGMTLLFTAGYVDLLGSACGLAGILTLLLVTAAGSLIVKMKNKKNK